MSVAFFGNPGNFAFEFDVSTLKGLAVWTVGRMTDSWAWKLSAMMKDIVSAYSLAGRRTPCPTLMGETLNLVDKKFIGSFRP